MKKTKFIVSLIAMPLLMGLSSCSSGAAYSYSHSHGPYTSRPDIEEQYAKGRMVFDYLLNPGSSFLLNNDTDPRRFTLQDVEFTKDNEKDAYTALIQNEMVTASSLYEADVNFDGYKDLCIGSVTINESKEKMLSIAIYDTHNSNKLLEYKDHGVFDYDFDLNDGILILEEMPFVNGRGNTSSRTVNRIGSFSNKNSGRLNIVWETFNYKLNGLKFVEKFTCVEDASEANTYIDNSGKKVFVLNTTNTFRFTVSLSFDGDFSTNTRQVGDCITFDISDNFDVEFKKDAKNGTFDYVVSFKSQGKYSFKASVEKYDATVQIEVNNTLYEQLKVA